MGILFGALVIFLAAMFPKITIRIGQLFFIRRLLPMRIREKTTGITIIWMDWLLAALAYKYSHGVCHFGGDSGCLKP